LAKDEGTGALYELAEIMDGHIADPRVMTTAVGALWALTALDDERKGEAFDVGIIDCIFKALTHDVTKENADFVEWAFGALACLSRGSENRNRITGMGCIKIIISGLKNHASSPGVFEWACRALHSLVHRYDDEDEQHDHIFETENQIKNNVVAIVEAGGVESILRGMSKNERELLATGWAIKLLLRLIDTDVQSPESDQFIHSILKKINIKEGVSCCVCVLKNRSINTEWFLSAAELVRIVVAKFPGDSLLLKKATESIVVTVRYMREHASDVDVQEEAINLFITLASVSKESKRSIKEYRGLAEVIKAMINFPDNLSLQENGSYLLWIASTSSSYFDLSSLNDALRVFEISTVKHKGSAAIQEAGCGFLANICHFSSVDVSDLGVDLAFRSLSLKFDTQSVHEQATRALLALSTKGSSVFEDSLDGSEIRFLVENMEDSARRDQYDQVDVLASLAASSDTIRLGLISSGCLDISMRMVKTARSAFGVSKSLELISALAYSETQQMLKVPSDIFQLVLDTLNAYRNDTDIAKQCCMVLRNLLLGSSLHGSSINFDGLVGKLIEIVDSRSDDIEVKQEACGALWAFSGKQPKQDFSVIMQMFKSVLDAMYLYRGEEQEYHSTFQSVASGALASITMNMRDHTFDLDAYDVDLMIAVMYMVMENDLDRVELLEKILEIVLHLSVINQQTVIQSGGIVVVIDAMVEHEQVETIQDLGCAILAVLASTENLQVNLCIAETDGIDMIVSALAVYTDNERVKVNTCKALSHLSVDRESRLLISSQGGLLLIVDAMNKNKKNIPLLENALAALLNLSSDTEEKVLADPNVLQTIISILKMHPDAQDMQEKGLGVLQNISMRNTVAKRSIAEYGGIDLITDLIREYLGSAEVLIRAFTALWSLGVLDENQILVAEKGGIDLVVNGMMANISYAKVQKQACGCLATLSTISRNKEMIRDVGGVDAIVYAMWAHFDSEALQVEACKALSTLAVNVDTSEVMLVSDSEVAVIMSAMRRYPNASRVQEHACVAMRNLMLSVDNVVVIRNNREELRTLMNKAARNFPSRCADRANQVLAGL